MSVVPAKAGTWWRLQGKDACVPACAGTTTVSIIRRDASRRALAPPPEDPRHCLLQLGHHPFPEPLGYQQPEPARRFRRDDGASRPVDLEAHSLEQHDVARIALLRDPDAAAVDADDGAFSIREHEGLPAVQRRTAEVTGGRYSLDHGHLPYR